MPNFYFDFTLDKDNENTKNFIDILTAFETSKLIETQEGSLIPVIQEPVANIYVNSCGGMNSVSAMMYHVLSNLKFQYNYIIHGSCSSNALLIMLALNPKHLTIMNQACSTVHLSTASLDAREILLSDKRNIDMTQFNDFRRYLTQLTKVYAKFLTKEELYHVKNGKDVELSPTRIKKAFSKLRKDKEFQALAKKVYE